MLGPPPNDSEKPELWEAKAWTNSRLGRLRPATPLPPPQTPGPSYLSSFFPFASKNSSSSESCGGRQGAAENSWLTFLILCFKSEFLRPERKHVQMMGAFSLGLVYTRVSVST